MKTMNSNCGGLGVLTGVNEAGSISLLVLGLWWARLDQACLIFLGLV